MTHDPPSTSYSGRDRHVDSINKNVATLRLGKSPLTESSTAQHHHRHKSSSSSSCGNGSTEKTDKSSCYLPAALVGITHMGQHTSAPPQKKKPENKKKGGENSSRRMGRLGGYTRFFFFPAINRQLHPDLDPPASEGTR